MTAKLQIISEKKEPLPGSVAVGGLFELVGNYNRVSG